MDAISNILSPLIGGASAQIFQILFETAEDHDDGLTVDQLVALGIAKTYGKLWPLNPEYSDALAALAEDFETLRYRGFSNSETHKAVSFIYAPRIFLINFEHFSKDFVTDLDNEQINRIVDNALLNFLDENGLEPGESFNYLVASLEDDKIIQSYFE